MDEDRSELTVRLCAAAGMIMEDASAKAILIMRLEQTTLSEQVRQVRQLAQQAFTLIEAAAALTQP